MEDYTNMLREVARNGGGTASPFVHLSKQAVVEPESQVLGSAEMFGETALRGKSTLRDFAKIMEQSYAVDSIIQDFAKLGGNARLERCKLLDTADVRGDAYILDSVIGGNTIIMGIPRVLRCSLLGNVRIADATLLKNVRVERNVTVVIEGRAFLRFPVEMALQGGTRLDDGVWARPPLVMDTPVFTMCEDIEDKVKVGCLSHSIVFWKEHGRKTLLHYGLKEDIFEKLYSALLEMEAFKLRNPSPKGKQ